MDILMLSLGRTKAHKIQGISQSTYLFPVQVLLEKPNVFHNGADDKSARHHSLERKWIVSGSCFDQEERRYPQAKFLV